jgi:hypothetical protein
MGLVPLPNIEVAFCAGFLVMHERGITEAFTSGRDFEQAGFRCLLSM